MFMGKTAFRTYFGAGFAADAIEFVFDAHDHAVVIVIFKIAVIVIKIISIKHVGFFDQIEYIARADFKAAAAADAGFLIDVGNVSGRPLRAAKGNAGYKIRHGDSPAQAASL
jgi:hypothetical protein